MEAWDYSPTASLKGGYVYFSFEVHVTPANDPPSIQGPTGDIWAGQEDSKIPLSNDGGIVLHDPDSSDSDSDLMEVKIAVGEGKLFLPLSFAGGLHLLNGDHPEGSREVWARGGLVELNRALQGLTYQAREEWSGVDEVEVWVSDLGGHQQGQAALESSAFFFVAVDAVGDTPTLRFPWAVHYLDEDTELKIDFVTVSDADPGSILTVEVRPDNGNTGVRPELSLADVWNSIEVSSDASAGVEGERQHGELILRGTAADVNTAVQMLEYTAPKDFAGQVVLSLRATDETGLSTEAETYLYVRPINDPPVIELPTDEDGETRVLEMTAGGAGDAVMGITITDVDAADRSDLCAYFEGVEARNALSLRLKSKFGNVSIVADSAIGVRVVDGPTAGPGETLFLQGSAKSLQAALDGRFVLYSAAADFSGHDVITVDVDDGGNCGAGGKQSTTRVLEIDVAPYDPPLLVAFDTSAVSEGSAMFTPEGAPLALPDVVVTGGSVRELSAVEVVILAKSGNVSIQQPDLESVQVLDSGELTGERLRIRGSPKALTTALAGLQFEPRPFFFGCWDRNMSFVDDTPVRSSRRQGGLALARVYAIATPDGTGGDVGWDGLSVKPHPSRSIAHLKVSVGWVNDPPTVDAPETVIVVASRAVIEPSLVPGIRVEDADVEDAPEGLGRLDVNVSTSMGSALAVDTTIALKNGLRNIGSSELHVRLLGQPEYVNNVLATLTISPNDADGTTSFAPGDRIDEILVVVSDLGFSGRGGEQSATASIVVEAGKPELESQLDHDVFALEKMLPLVSTTEGAAVAVPGLEAAFSHSSVVDDQLAVIVSAKEGYLSLGPSSAGVAEAAAKEDWGSAVTLVSFVGGAEQTLPEVQVSGRDRQRAACRQRLGALSYSKRRLNMDMVRESILWM